MLNRVFSLSLFVVVLIGCASQPVSISPSSSPLAVDVRGSIPTHGVDCQYKFLGIISVSPPVNTQNALQEAKDNANVDVLTDVTVDQSFWYFIIFSNNCVHVRGLGVPRELTNH